MAFSHWKTVFCFAMEILWLIFQFCSAVIVVDGISEHVMLNDLPVKSNSLCKLYDFYQVQHIAGDNTAQEEAIWPLVSTLAFQTFRFICFALWCYRFF